MLKYNAENTELVAWRKKIEATETAREALKKELLDLLTDKSETASARLQNFNRRKNALLNDAPDWSWNPHFNWLWPILRVLSFFRFNTNPQPGSRLREALSEKPKIEQLVIAASQQSETDVSLEEEAFEQALFDDPELALKDVQNKIQTLEKDKKTVSVSRIIQVVERLEAIKYRLASQDYCHFLQKLFILDPRSCLAFYYKLYQEDNHDLPNAHEYMEHYFMAQALVTLFVTPSDATVNDDDLNPYIFDVSRLVILLIPPKISEFKQANSQKNNDPLLALIDSQTSLAEDQIYDLTRNDKLDQIKVSKQRKDIQLRHDAYNIPSNLAEDYYAECGPIKNHPLLVQFARITTEVLLCTAHHSLPKNWGSGSVGHLILDLLSKRILETWPDDSFNIKSVTHHNQILFPYAHNSGITSTYRAAEKFAVEIILSASNSEEEGLKAARRICCQNSQNLTAPEIDWVLHRVGTKYPKLCPALKLIFNEITVYALRDLTLLKADAYNLTADEMLSNIKQFLADAKDAHSKLDTESENRASRSAIDSFHYLLNHYPLTSKQLNIAYHDILEPLDNTYIAPELFRDWSSKIMDLNDKQIKDSKMLENVSNIDLDSYQKIAQGNYLSYTEQLCLQIHTSKTHSSPDFVAIEKNSQSAVICFALFISECQEKKQEKKIGIKEIAHAGAILRNYLKHSISEKQFQQWSEIIDNLQTHSPGRSKESFFESQTQNKSEPQSKVFKH